MPSPTQTAPPPVDAARRPSARAPRRLLLALVGCSFAACYVGGYALLRHRRVLVHYASEEMASPQRPDGSYDRRVAHAIDQGGLDLWVDPADRSFAGAIAALVFYPLCIVEAAAHAARDDDLVAVGWSRRYWSGG